MRGWWWGVILVVDQTWIRKRIFHYFKCFCNFFITHNYRSSVLLGKTKSYILWNSTILHKERSAWFLLIRIFLNGYLCKCPVFPSQKTLVHYNSKIFWANSTQSVFVLSSPMLYYFVFTNFWVGDSYSAWILQAHCWKSILWFRSMPQKKSSATDHWAWMTLV